MWTQATAETGSRNCRGLRVREVGGGVGESVGQSRKQAKAGLTGQDGRGSRLPDRSRHALLLVVVKRASKTERGSDGDGLVVSSLVGRDRRDDDGGRDLIGGSVLIVVVGLGTKQEAGGASQRLRRGRDQSRSGTKQKATHGLVPLLVESQLGEKLASSLLKGGGAGSELGGELRHGGGGRGGG